MKKILVVDDDQQIRELLLDFFHQLGFEVTTAANGVEALGKFSPDDTDCILSDLVMPDMGGLELLKKIKTQAPKIPFLVITGYPSIETALEVMKQGAYDYITKPFQMEDVRIKVERALQTQALQKSVKSLTGIAWAVIISIPIWLILGIIFGRVWK
ncbi:MAG: response regulator [Thermodesulfobacteriota bacterium]